MQISTISPSTFDDGKPVTLTGSGFGSSQGQVLIGGAAQNVNTWSDTSITFTTVRGSQSLGACRVDVVRSAGLSGGTAALGWAAASLADGETLTITTDGTYSFGAAPSAWLFDTVDNQSAYSALNPGDVVPITGSAPYRYRKNTNMVIENANPRRAGSRHYRSKEVSGFNNAEIGNPVALGGSSPNVNQLELFGRFFVYSDNTVSGSESIKFFRVWDNGNGYGTRISWTLQNLTYPISKVLFASSKPTGGAWELVEMHVKFTSRDSAAGTIKCWKNGSLIYDVSDATCPSTQQTGPNIGSPITEGLNWFGAIAWDAGSDYTPDCVVDFADAWFCTSPQRVVVSSSSTWSGRGSVQEVQDIVSWSNTSITAKVFNGQFASVSGKYLYVIGSDGNPVSTNGVAI